MKALTLILLGTLLTGSLSALAQREAPAPLPDQLITDLARLRDAALASDYALRQTAYLCNNIGPRLSGSPQAARAVEYIAGEMRALGLDVRLEEVRVPHWVRGEESAALTQFPGMAPGTTQKIVITALGPSVATPPAGLLAPVVVVRSFDELNRLGQSRVQGRIVLFNVKFDEAIQDQGSGTEAYGQAVAYRSGGAVAAARLGAVAALNRSAGSSAFRKPHTGSVRYDEGVPRIPAAAITAEDAELIAHLAAQGEVKLRLVITPQTMPDAISHNVIADLRGYENPEQVVIVSGHLDSWDLGTGALDDAVGVATAMEVVNLCRKLGLRPRRTIRVIPYMNEENGLRGGTTYFENQRHNLANHIAAIESDLGAGHPTGFYAHVVPRALPMLQPLARVLQSGGAGIIRLVSNSVGADISPLENAGVPGFAPITDTRHYFKYHHTAADTFDKVDPRNLAENAAVMAVLAYGIAAMPEPLPR
ncbi:MAG: M28 family peptidase [Acidobacteriota bacterium]